MVATPLYAGLLVFWYIVLSLKVIQHRQTGIKLGDGGDPLMLRVIRGHANFAEYVPLALIMMAVLEYGHTSIYLLHALGIVLLLGRILHGYALSFTKRWRFGRVWGTVLTYVVLIVEGVLCVVQGLRGMALT
jgi:uncharacterized membrane protein YecN with MAPEG domain